MRRFLALLICLTMLLPLVSAPHRVYAADSYLITVAEDTVLQNVSDNGMAVYIDGIIYIPYDTIRSLKNVYVNYNESEQLVTVFSVGRNLQFELDTGMTYDSIQQQSIRVSAKMRDGVPYLPVSIVAASMGLYFSFTSASDSGVGYPVIRLAGSTPAVADKTVFSRNGARLRSVALARDRASGIVSPEPPVELPPRTVSLLFADMARGEAAFPLYTMLDALESYDMKGAFFFSEEELLPAAESLRELYCRGHAPGILLTDGALPLEQALRCAELYAQLLHIRVRTVCVYGVELAEEQKSALTQAGFEVWQPTYDPYDEEITAGKLNNAAQKVLRSAPEQSSLRLQCDTITLEALPMLYSYLEAQNFTVAPVNEWTKPY